MVEDTNMDAKNQESKCLVSNQKQSSSMNLEGSEGKKGDDGIKEDMQEDPNMVILKQKRTDVSGRSSVTDKQSFDSNGEQKLAPSKGNQAIEELGNEEDESEEEGDNFEMGNPQLFTALDRNNLYEKGVTLLKKKKRNHALKCFQTCIKDLNETNGFTFLPQCLRKIADLYYEKGEYEKAIQFIQAEKMYYETALIDTSTIQRKLESFKLESDPNQEKVSTDTDSEKPEVVRAEEFENLARMCLENKQAQLALEYQAKATKIRQQVLGEDHPITIKSLDFFTVVYAEVGKQQYSESMQKLCTEKIDDSSHQEKKNLTKIKSKGEGKSDMEQVEEQIRKRERDESLTRFVLWILFFIWVVVLSLIVFYLYCKIDVNSRSCAAWRADIHYYYMRFKYFFYTSLSSPENTYG